MPDVPHTPPSLQLAASSKAVVLLHEFPQCEMTEIPIVLLFESEITNIGGNGGEAFTIPMARQYDPPDSPRIFAAVSNLLTMRQTSTGRWKTIDLHCGQNTSATSIIFNVRKNGEAMLAGAGRLIVPNGSSSVSRVVDIEATLGDLIELSVEQVPAIGIATPVDINIRTEVS